MIKENSRSKTIITAVLVLSFLTCIIGCAVPEGSQVGDKAPDFTLSTLDGGRVNLADLEGKPVVLVFWTTGCSACIYQMPFLEAADDELGDAVEFVSINMGESNYQVQATLEYYGVSLPVALDSNETTSEAYNIIYTPTNIIIDKQGFIRYIRKGAFTSATEIIDILNGLE
jgi:peroxiredoxin